MGVEIRSINVQIHAVCSFLVRSGANKWSTNSTQWWRHPNDTHHCCVSLFCCQIIVARDYFYQAADSFTLIPHFFFSFCLPRNLWLLGLKEVDLCSFGGFETCQLDCIQANAITNIKGFHFPNCCTIFTQGIGKKLLVRLLRTLRSYCYVLSKTQHYGLKVSDPKILNFPPESPS